MASDFEIQIQSDDVHEDLVAEILYRGEFCVLLSQENGFDKLEIEIIHAQIMSIGRSPGKSFTVP